MTDAYPNIDEFGAGSCTCQGTMTGCAVCSTANVLVRYGKAIPRLAGGTPDMRTLGRQMGARHRAIAPAGTPGDRHGLSLDGYCTGGTNWCAYCAFGQLRAQGVPVAYGQRSWDQIVGYIKARQPVILPGRYGAIPYVFPSSYSSVKPARGRSDAGFGGPHMMDAWAMSTSSTVICSDSDFGSPSRSVVPPHSVLTLAALKAYWSAYSWSVCYVTKEPPSLTVVVPVWGSDVPASIRGFGVNTVARAIKHTGVGRVHWSGVINLGDIAAGLDQIGHDYGSRVDPSDVQVLVTWAKTH